MQAVASRLSLLLVILSVMPGTAQSTYGGETSIAGQGWRALASDNNLQALKAKFDAKEASIGQGRTGLRRGEAFANRDKNMMTVQRRAELQRLEGQAGLNQLDVNAAESMMADTLLLVFMMAAGAFVLIFVYVFLKGRGLINIELDDVASGTGEKAFHAKQRGFNLMNVELIQQALIVMRHTSTQTMDRLLDIAEAGISQISGVTTKLRQTSRQKKDDPDENAGIDILELNHQAKPGMSHESLSDSLLDLEKLKIQCQQMSDEPINNSSTLTIEDLVKKYEPGVNLDIGDEELTQIPLDDDADNAAVEAAVEALPNNPPSYAGPAHLESIDELLSKTTALL